MSLNQPFVNARGFNMTLQDVESMYGNPMAVMNGFSLFNQQFGNQGIEWLVGQVIPDPSMGGGSPYGWGGQQFAYNGGGWGGSQFGYGGGGGWDGPPQWNWG